MKMLIFWVHQWQDRLWLKSWSIEMPDGYAIVETGIPAAWDGKKIGELDVRSRYGVNILGICHGKMDMNITPETVLHADEHMLVLGRIEVIQKQFLTERKG